MQSRAGAVLSSSSPVPSTSIHCYSNNASSRSNKMKFINVLPIIFTTLLTLASAWPLSSDALVARDALDRRATCDLAIRDTLNRRDTPQCKSPTCSRLIVPILHRNHQLTHTLITDADVSGLCKTISGDIYVETTDNDARRRSFTKSLVANFVADWPGWNIIVVHDYENDIGCLPPNNGHIDWELQTPVFLYPSATIGFQVYWFPQGYSSW